MSDACFSFSKPILHHPLSLFLHLVNSLHLCGFQRHICVSPTLFKFYSSVLHSASSLSRPLLKCHVCILHYIIILELQVLHSMLNISFFAEQFSSKNISTQFYLKITQRKIKLIRPGLIKWPLFLKKLKRNPLQARATLDKAWQASSLIL